MRFLIPLQVILVIFGDIGPLELLLESVLLMWFAKILLKRESNIERTLVSILDQVVWLVKMFTHSSNLELLETSSP